MRTPYAPGRTMLLCVTAAVVAAGALIVACVALVIWFWPRLIAEGDEGGAVPVIFYMAVLAAMVCAALLARMPTPWIALGAVCFAISDGMIGIGKFVLQSQVLAVPIWWAYATSILLITAGFLFGRSPRSSDDSATPPV